MSGGRYSLDDLDGFLAAIEQALPVAVLRGSDGAVRVVARPARGAVRIHLQRGRGRCPQRPGRLRASAPCHGGNFLVKIIHS